MKVKFEGNDKKNLMKKNIRTQIDSISIYFFSTHSLTNKLKIC